VGGVVFGVVTCGWVGGGDDATGGFVVCTGSGAAVAVGTLGRTATGAATVAGWATAAAGAPTGLRTGGSVEAGTDPAAVVGLVVDELWDRDATVIAVAAVVLDVGAPGTGA
jgi:hypothetical protein